MKTKWAIFFLLMLTALTVYSIYLFNLFFCIDHGIEILQFNEKLCRKEAVLLYMQKAENIGTISLAIIAVLWAFIMHKDQKVEIRGASSIALFIVANIFLIASFFFYYIGNKRIISNLFLYDSMDIYAPIMEYTELMQTINFSLGIISCAAIVILCREDKTEEIERNER